MAENRRYEVMLIADPRLEDAKISDAFERTMGVVRERGGEVVKADHWGRRRLAHELDDHTEGYYIVADVDAEPSAVAELDRVLGLADEIVRHKIVRPGKK